MSKGGIETNIGNHIKLDLSPRTVLFRNNSGRCKYERKEGQAPIWVPFGVGPHGGGGSDNIGWTSLEITADMVGKKIAVFTAIEIKTLEGEADEKQINFVEQVRKAGGYAGFASTKEDAREIVGLK